MRRRRNPGGSDPRAPGFGSCLRFLVSGGKCVSGVFFLRSFFICFVCFISFVISFVVCCVLLSGGRGDEGTATEPTGTAVRKRIK